MTKNPILNALSATCYIILIVSIINFLSKNIIEEPKSVVAPIIFLSMLSLSAAVMGFVFLAQPLMLYLDGKKKQAVELIIKTIGSFAAITAVILALFLLRIIK